MVPRPETNPEIQRDGGITGSYGISVTKHILQIIQCTKRTYSKRSA